MTPEIFVSDIRMAVIDQNNVIYKQLLESTSVQAASDPYWKRALSLYASLGNAERNILLEIMRQTAVDTVSNIFGILDGASSLSGKPEKFILTCKTDNQKINGKLQDLFLEEEERVRK